MACALGALVLCMAPAMAQPANAAPAHRFHATLTVERPAPFVALPLTPSIYAHSERGRLADLQVVDAQGQNLPFALVAAPAAARTVSTQERPAKLYALPPAALATPSGQAAPVQIWLQGQQVVVAANPAAPSAKPAAPSPGWVVDTGAQEPQASSPNALRVEWAAAADFNQSLQVDSSDDLKTWRGSGHAQLVSLTSGEPALRQPVVPLPAGIGRYVRLRWDEPAAAPALTGAWAQTTETLPSAGNDTAASTFTASAVPLSEDPKAPGAMVFELPAPLPVAQLTVQWPQGNQLWPLRVQWRADTTGPWQEGGAAVFYRLQRSDTASFSPPLALATTARQFRLVPTQGTLGLATSAPSVQVQAKLPWLVFVQQGTAPYELRAGASAGPNMALPASTLMANVEEERPRFGRASLQPFSENTQAAAQAAQQQRWAEWRPRLLWAVLLLGVAGLGAMVWRL